MTWTHLCVLIWRQTFLTGVAGRTRPTTFLWTLCQTNEWTTSIMFQRWWRGCGAGDRRGGKGWGQKHINMVKACQMISWRMKNGPHFIIIRDTVTNVVALHSLHQAPLYDHNLTSLAWFLWDVACLSMLFILEVLCTACYAEHLNNK